MLRAHELVGVMLAPNGMVLIVTAILLWWPGGGPAWPIPVAVSMFLATGIQIGAGFSRRLGLHVPLGVALVAGGVLLVVWAWRPKRHPRADGSTRFGTAAPNRAETAGAQTGWSGP